MVRNTQFSSSATYHLQHCIALLGPPSRLDTGSFQVFIFAGAAYTSPYLGHDHMKELLAYRFNVPEQIHCRMWRGKAVPIRRRVEY
jgi:hypothetical protein